MALPTLSSIAPISGPAAGGTIVTLTGTGFTGALAVGFGDSNAASLTVLSDTQIIAISPAGSGTVNVTVVSPGGRSAINASAQFAFTSEASSTAAPTYFVDPALTSQIVGSLVNLVAAGASPDAVQAQSILMRRLALEGDVIGSRVPPPRNITEIGGYLNLLTTLKESAMQEQALAGILGVAGPSPALGWSPAQPLAMVSLPNDRPAGPAQATLPLSILVRSDFMPAFHAAITALHAQGAALPLAGPTALALPPGGPGSIAPTDFLLYAGRVLQLAPAAAMVTPSSDPLALIRAKGSGDPFLPAANVPAPGSVPVTPGNYDALQASGGGTTTVSLTGASFVPLAPVLASFGFYQASPAPQPASGADIAWARLTNVTGLVAGSTRLGDELALIFPQNAISASAFAPLVDYKWNGTTFAP
ncbi:IPT/TIG domain-containing protein [Phenylobacterium montanum]|uniref:IPT/TIG domain-containing protein n=1 Tax=Phenylobacterium montanum TaxID=2823693 RepID=A0A975G0K0_9CAUL|nr:IPT/TIG domain-containing protein [Caulobacter sp. S6]QUD88313.1 IPT/TIG domain-containing protein [Caulobacter sp. S6]